MRALLILVFCGLAAGAELPKIMLWAWATPEDFRFLKSEDVGVAYLALSIHLEGREDPMPNPRAQPVYISPQTWQTVVIRLDFDSYGIRKPEFTDRQRKLVVQMIAEIAELSHAPGIQIDFDAPESAYPFYRRLLAGVRQRLGPKVFLSMTALVSWCTGDHSWLAGLPTDEIVPMAFYMGRSTPAIRTLLDGGGNFGFAGCRGSLGVHLAGYGESAKPRKDARDYFFSAEPWTADSVQIARRAAQR
ncbi:MAG TPA: hypothetical protein VK708_04810 [Bryobacteraceae bacterium]|nr:hypothetical protein [Bryobacteraceae bacterium]